MKYMVYTLGAAAYFVYEVDDDNMAKRILSWWDNGSIHPSMGDRTYRAADLNLQDPTPRQLEEIEMFLRCQFLGVTP